MNDNKTYLAQARRIIAANKERVVSGISKNGYGRTYLAKRSFKKGEVVFQGFGRLHHKQTKLTSIQIEKNQHFIPLKMAGRFLNHSCNPNCFVRTQADGFPEWVASRPISKGTEITYGYYMTEYSWHKGADEVFIDCSCNAKVCTGKIRSFNLLSKKEQKEVKKRNLVSKHLTKY